MTRTTTTPVAESPVGETPVAGTCGAGGGQRIDRASVRRLPDLGGVETLSARYVRQTFKPHAHDEYLIGVIDGGVHAVWCRGEMHRVPQGSVVTMRPGDIHHGGAGSVSGWHQRML